MEEETWMERNGEVKLIILRATIQGAIRKLKILPAVRANVRNIPFFLPIFSISIKSGDDMELLVESTKD